jgi:hypothetical protein
MLKGEGESYCHLYIFIGGEVLWVARLLHILEFQGVSIGLGRRIWRLNFAFFSVALDQYWDSI